MTNNLVLNEKGGVEVLLLGSAIIRAHPEELQRVMTSTTDSPEVPLSLNSAFSPPTRQRWAEMAVAGLGTEKSTMDALNELRRTTLEGIPFEVLYDSAEISLHLACDEKSTVTQDNRLCVKTDDANRVSRDILQGLQGGITSIELHTGTPADISFALSGVDLDLATLSLRSADHYEACAKAFLDLACERHLDTNALRCNFNADPVSVALATGADESDMSLSLARMSSFVKTTAAKLPSSTCLLVDVALHHNAGASTVEELHAALATATVYLESLLDAGIPLGVACEQIVFQVAMDADVLIGVAKLRALRALWQTVVAQIDGPSTNQIRATVVAETSHRFLSTLQPWNNHLRNLCAGTAAMLGGADTLIVHPHDALQRSTKEFDTSLGDRMARNTPIILERECGLGKVQDPMAGSYAIENLTQQLMRHAWESLAATDTGDGWINELLSGRWQTRLTQTHHQRISLMQQDQRIAIGVNRFVQADGPVSTAPQDSGTTVAQALVAVRDAETFETAVSQEISS